MQTCIDACGQLLKQKLDTTRYLKIMTVELKVLHWNGLKGGKEPQDFIACEWPDWVNYLQARQDLVVIMNKHPSLVCFSVDSVGHYSTLT
jgi:hypothetical protein